jgi:diguanylate cyclase
MAVFRAVSVDMPSTNALNQNPKLSTPDRWFAGLITKVRLALAGEANSDLLPEDIKKVGRFLYDHGLAPAPCYYDLVYRFLAGEDEQISFLIARYLKSDGTIRPEQLDAIREQEEQRERAELVRPFVTSINRYLSEGMGTFRSASDQMGAVSESLKNFVDGDELLNKPEAAAEKLLKATRAIMETANSARHKLDTLAKQVEYLTGELAHAQRIARTDSLTNLLNRRAFEERLAENITNSVETGYNFCLALCDIDHFKRINDQFGHDVGDRVIRFVAKCIMATIGDCATVARIGGEEFAVIFQNMGAAESLGRLEAMRADLAQRNIVEKNGGGAIGSVTISCGLVEYVQDQFHSSTMLIKNADILLYKAKANGRDRVEI